MYALHFSSTGCRSYRLYIGYIRHSRVMEASFCVHTAPMVRIYIYRIYKYIYVYIHIYTQGGEYTFPCVIIYLERCEVVVRQLFQRRTDVMCQHAENARLCTFTRFTESLRAVGLCSVLCRGFECNQGVGGCYLKATMVSRVLDTLMCFVGSSGRY